MRDAKRARHLGGLLLAAVVVACGSDGHAPAIDDTVKGGAGQAGTKGSSPGTGTNPDATSGGDAPSEGGVTATAGASSGGQTTNGGANAGSAGKLNGGAGMSFGGMGGGMGGGGMGGGGMGGGGMGGGGMGGGGMGGMPPGGMGGGGMAGMPAGGMGGGGAGGMGGGGSGGMPMGGNAGNGGVSSGGSGGASGSGGSAGQASSDPCSPNPCLHAGTCAKDTGVAVCTCKGPWDGATCNNLYYGDPALQNEARLSESNASCHEESFLDLSDWLPDPNAGIDDPTLSISCTASTMSVTSNSVPQYKIDWADPKRTSYANTLVPTTTTYPFPLSPVFNAVPKQATVVGGVGVAINGVQISSPSASGGPLKYADPESIEIDGDTCDGHPNPQGKYHYHAMMPSCLYLNAEDGDSVGDACTAPSPIIGWIADGYPIYGPCECLDAACTQVVEMLSSYKKQGGDGDPSACAYQDYTYVGDATEYSDGDQYLDECSGHIGPNGDYHYHMTNAYPWTLRCYRGNPTTTMAQGHTYDASAGKNDCCFEKECVGGVFQNVGCQMATCTP
jgi:hypothetical protein